MNEDILCVVIEMETKDVILSLRNQLGLSQEELAKEVFVTRQAVSRWENGDTIPNVETLKLLSKVKDLYTYEFNELNAVEFDTGTPATLEKSLAFPITSNEMFFTTPFSFILDFL